MKKIQIKIDSSARGSAPQGAIDYNTLLPLALWRGEPVEIVVALYTDAETPDTMTDVTEMNLEISTDAAHTTPLVSSSATVANTRLGLTLDDADWLTATAQHGLFPLAKGDIDPDMAGQSRLDLWLRVTMIQDSEWIVLCNGNIVCHEAGAWPV